MKMKIGIVTKNPNLKVVISNLERLSKRIETLGEEVSDFYNDVRYTNIEIMKMKVN